MAQRIRKGSDPRRYLGKQKWLVIVSRSRFESGVKNKQPTPQLEVKTLLNRTQHFVGFIYHSIRLRGSGGSLRVEVKIPPHRGIRGKCSTCQRPGPGYDSLEERRWLFVPLWGIVVHFFYPPRRGECPEPGVGVEPIPWSQGQRRVTTARSVPALLDLASQAQPARTDEEGGADAASSRETLA